MLPVIIDLLREGASAAGAADTMPQLSMPDRLSQLFNIARPIRMPVAFGVLWCLWASIIWSLSASAQSPDFERQIEPLTTIDKQFMAEQRARVEQLANRLGRNLTGNADRDIDTLQRIIDDRLIQADDTLTQQALGIVLGDLFSQRLDMDWVVYRDPKGRSRALRYRDTDIYLFPVTMISRRQAAGSLRPIKPLYDEAVRETLLRIPGGKWFI